MVEPAAPGTLPVGVGPGTVLLLALWIGLIAGFLDLGLLVVNRRLINRDFYRLGGDFTWIIPAGVTILVLVPAIVIALIARISGGAIRLGAAVVGALLHRVPRRVRQASPGTMGGAAHMRRARHAIRPDGTAPPGGVHAARAPLGPAARRNSGDDHAGHDRRTCLVGASCGVGLASLARRRPERAADRLGYGAGQQPEPLRLRTSDHAQPGTAWPAAECDSTWRSRSSSWTLPSHASMFTGRWPHELGVDWKSPLRDDVPTLAEYLSSHGYETAGFAANLDYCSRETGLARGMVHYEDFPIDVYDAFSRYVALGHRIEVSSWAFLLDRLVEKCFGRWYDLVPRLEGACEERRGRGSGVPGLARAAARPRPPLLCLPELQRRPQSLRGSRPIDPGLRSPARVQPGPADPRSLELARQGQTLIPRCSDGRRCL